MQSDKGFVDHYDAMLMDPYISDVNEVFSPHLNAPMFIPVIYD
jgi:hypothetical protein